MRRKKIRIRLGAIALLTCFVWQFVIFPPVAFAVTVDVPVGTVVLVVFNDDVDPKAVAAGQIVMLSAVSPVVVKGFTVIEAGAPVLGEVTVAEKRGSIGEPAKVGVALRYVTAVDGTNIPLSGQKLIEGESKQATSLVITILCCVLGLLMKGDTAIIPAGAQVQATTMAPVTITVAD